MEKHTLSIAYLNNQTEINNELNSFYGYLKHIYNKFVNNNESNDNTLQNLYMYKHITKTTEKTRNAITHIGKINNMNCNELTNLSRNEFLKYSKYILNINNPDDIQNNEENDEATHAYVALQTSAINTS